MKILHKVASGETLQSIANTYGCEVEELVKMNELQNRFVTPKDVLVIPSNQTDFVVLKNFDKEVLVEVTEHNLEQIENMVKNKNVECSCGNVKNATEGDKLLLGKQQPYVVVKPLETLQSIATRLGLNEDSMVKQNKLKTKRVFIGQKLYY